MDNFENTNVPPCPDLVKEGLIRQDLTTYEQLVDGYSDPTNIFLQKSLAFNMQQNMLGICTRFKEDVCYTQSLKDEYNTKEAIWLSTLLSCLVDRSKQGYSFMEDDWTHFKRTVVKFPTRRPLYKNEDGHFDRNAKHIIDRLMYTAHRTIKSSIEDFHSRLPNPPHWDPDLVTYYKWARKNAETEPLWKILLDDLDKDITALRDEWKRKWPRTQRSFREGEESKADFMPKVAQCYAIYQAILPKTNNALTQSLLRDCFDVEVSDWAHLRASALFHSYNRMKGEVSRFVWHMAGKQLSDLKCWSCGGFPPAITPGMYAMLKPDPAYVKRAKANGFVMDESMSVTNADEIEDLRDD